jgi:hypothetical protein
MGASSSRPARGALQRFMALPGHRRALAIEAVVALGIARLLILTTPTRWIVRRLEQQAERSRAQAGAAGEAAREVGWAVRAAAPKTPWQSACLAQAIAGKWMLGRRGLRATIRLGVAKDAAGNIRAHAWLYSGDTILAGGAQAPRFTTIADLE